MSARRSKFWAGAAELTTFSSFDFTTVGRDIAFATLRQMKNTNSICDPLTINLSRQTRLLSDLLPRDSPHLAALRNASSRPGLLIQLSRLLATPGLTITVATLFRPLLLELCARWLEEDGDLEDKLEGAALLLEIHPEIFPCVSICSYIRCY